MGLIFNVTDYGACAGAAELQTKYIQAAIDACFAAGGGEVVVPAGVFRTATIRLRSHITLHLLSGAILEGSTDPEDYTHFAEDTVEPVIPISDEDIKAMTDPFCRWSNALIKCYQAENVKILGEEGSFIDGENCYDPQGEEKYRGPHAIYMFRCHNIEYGGYTVRDSGNWSHTHFKCRNIYAHDLKVLGGHDGFHCRMCDNILVENCQFYTGDDCVAGFDNQNMVVRNCYMDCACSAMRLGGTDILIDCCHTHAPSRYGFRGSLSPEEKAASAPTNETHRHTMHTPFLYFCDFPTKIRKTPGNITVQNCIFENPNSFFRLWFDGKHPWCANRCLNDIIFRNCKAIGVSMPLELLSDKDEQVSFRLENVEISAREGYEDVDFMHAENFKEIHFRNVKVSGYRHPPTIKTKTDGPIHLVDTEGIAVQKVKDYE